MFERERRQGDDTRDFPRNDNLNLDEGKDRDLALILSFKLERDKDELNIFRVPERTNACVELLDFLYFPISISEMLG